MALALGGSALTAAWLAAPRARRGPVALEPSGLTPPMPRAVAEVASPATGVGGNAWGALSLGLVGLVLLGAGWDGLQQARVGGSLLARLAPGSVSAVGSLRTDPAMGSYGWSAIVDVTTVAWDGGEATLRESVWVSGDEELPTAVRGDQVRLEGSLGFPTTKGSPTPSLTRGWPRSSAAHLRSPRTVREPVRARHPDVPRVRRAVDRPTLPARERQVCCWGWSWVTIRSSIRRSPVTSTPPAWGTCSSSPERTSRWCWRRSSRSRPGPGSRGGRGSSSRCWHGRLLRRAHRSRAVGDARGRDGHAHAPRRADGQAAVDRPRSSPGACWC